MVLGVVNSLHPNTTEKSVPAASALALGSPPHALRLTFPLVGSSSGLLRSRVATLPMNASSSSSSTRPATRSSSGRLPHAYPPACLHPVRFLLYQRRAVRLTPLPAPQALRRAEPERCATYCRPGHIHPVRSFFPPPSSPYTHTRWFCSLCMPAPQQTVIGTLTAPDCPSAWTSTLRRVLLASWYAPQGELDGRGARRLGHGCRASLRRGHPRRCQAHAAAAPAQDAKRGEHVTRQPRLGRRVLEPHVRARRVPSLRMAFSTLT